MNQPTSAEAWLKLPAEAIQRKIAEALSLRADMTNQEIGRSIGRDASTVSGMNVPMRRKGWVVKSCERRCEVTGRNAIAWKLAGGTEKENMAMVNGVEVPIFREMRKVVEKMNADLTLFKLQNQAKSGIMEA